MPERDSQRRPLPEQARVGEPDVSGGIVRAPWVPGPCDGTSDRACVSVTDFMAASMDDFGLISQIGLQLGQTWPVMQGAVGLWLWAKPDEFRGGSVSVWASPADLRRFVAWPVHAEIMRAWRGRISVGSDFWEADRFDAEEAWARAQRLMQQPHTGRRAPAT